LKDGSDGIISTIKQIELNRNGLASEISARASATSQVKVQLVVKQVQDHPQILI
jgi:hypothetical protein